MIKTLLLIGISLTSSAWAQGPPEGDAVLRARVAFLQAQLADRDAMVRTLQLMLEEEKHHVPSKNVVDAMSSEIHASEVVGQAKQKLDAALAEATPNEKPDTKPAKPKSK